MLTRTLAVLLFLTLAVMGQGTIVYIDPDHTGTESGSITEPYNTIAEAMGARGTDPGTYEFRLKRGTVALTDTALQVVANTRFVAYGSGAKPIVRYNGTSTGGYCFLIVEGEARDLYWSDIVCSRASNGGWQFRGHAENVVLERCEAWRCFTGFQHETSTTATGRVIYRDCRALRCVNDGFSNRASARDLAVRCEAKFCGFQWNTWETIAGSTVYQKPPQVGEDGRLRNIYLDTVAGSNSGDGLSPGRPKLTVAGIEAILQPGDIIHVKRGSICTTTLDLLPSCSVVPYGTGPTPEFQPSSGNGIELAANCYLYDLIIEGATTGINGAANVDGCVLNRVVVELCTDAIDFPATSNGTVTMIRVLMSQNSIDGCQTAGAVVNAYECFSNDHDNVASRGFSSTGNGRMNLYGCQSVLDSVGYQSLVTATSTQYVMGCWFREGDSAGTTTPTGVSVIGSTGVNVVVANSVFVMMDPGSGDSVVAGVAVAGAGSNVLVYGNSFWDNNSGSNSAPSAGILALTSGGVTMRNNLFESFDNALSTFVTMESGFSNLVAASHNWYVDPGAAPSNWNDGSDQTYATWGIVTGVDDDVSGSYLTGGRMGSEPQSDLTEAVLSTDGVGGPAAQDGLNLSTFAETLAIPFIKYDLGLRDRSITIGPYDWARGAMENNNASSDGFTTHNSSSWRMVECVMSWCEDCAHLTHTDNPDSEDDAIIDCVMDTPLRFALNSSSPIGHTIDGLTIKLDSPWGQEFAASGPDASGSASEQVWNRVFLSMPGRLAEHGLELGSQTARITNSVLIGPDFSTQGSIYTVRVSGGALEVFHSVMVNPIHTGENCNAFGIYSNTGYTGNNNAFASNDVDSAYFLRVDSAGELTESDNNWYLQNTTNTSLWYVASGQTFATWQGYNKGTAAASTDGNGSHTTTDFIFPDIRDPRFLGVEAYEVIRGGAAWGQGKDLSATLRYDVGGRIRAASGGTYNVGLFVYSEGATGLFRMGSESGGAKLLFSQFTLDSDTNTDIRLNVGPVLSTQRVVIQSFDLSLDGTRTKYILTEGPTSDDRPVKAGVITDQGRAFGVFSGSPGKSLYLTFSGTSGTLSGEISYRIENVQGGDVVPVERATGLGIIK